MSDEDTTPEERKVAAFYAQERAQKMERPEGCICQWEYSPVIQEPWDADWERRFHWQSTVWYREIKHYINPNCVVHVELLRPMAQVAVEQFKEKFPEAMKLAKTLAGEGDEKKQELTQGEDAVYFEFSTYRLRVPRSEVEKGWVNLGLTDRVDHSWPAYQFWSGEERTRWAKGQAAWLVWKTFDDDPWLDAKGGNVWITKWDSEDPYFWMLEAKQGDKVGQGHCGTCHHVCSIYCDQNDKMLVNHSCAHTMGCPSC